MSMYIVILHYKKLDVTKKCIQGLIRNEKDFTKIILVNNDSEDLTAKDFSKNGNKIIVINNGKNLGFAAGVNKGINFCLKEKADFILLLNNDTNVEKPLIKPLLDTFEKEKNVGIVGPAIEFIRDKKQIYDLGGDVNLLFGRTRHYEVEKIKGKSNRNTLYVSGCCMLIKKDVFKEVGLFDEQFFLYYEDVDFCLRAKDKGFLSFVNPSVIIHHDLSETIGKVNDFAVYNQTKSGLLFGKKWCKVEMFNVLFLLVQSLKIYLKNKKAGKVGFKAIIELSFQKY